MKPTIFYKNYLVALSAIFLLSACANLQKTIDQGNYDLAVITAVKKLRGKTKKKQKYVAALEEAFKKANGRDMNRIENLRIRNHIASWEKIHSLALGIERRQNLISPLLPVIDQEGYKANFKYVRASVILENSADMAANLLYDEAREYLALAEKGDKYSAKKAYRIFQRINMYKVNYKDVIELSHQAHELGIVHVLYKVNKQTRHRIPRTVMNDFRNIDIAGMNTFWEKYHVGNINFLPDYEMILTVRDIDISPELISEKEYSEKKQIQAGYTNVLNKKGKPVLDSLGKEVRVPRIKWVYADVLRTSQKREACMHANLVIKDVKNNSIVSSRKLSGKTVFENCFMEFVGDSRALSAESKNHLNHRPLPFPSNRQMILDASCKLLPLVRNSVRSANLS